MAEFIRTEEKVVNADELVIFENNTDSDFSVSTAIVFRKSGLYEVSIARRRTIISKVAERKKGKWIYHNDDLFPAESTMECDQCHEEQPLTCDDEFCPHCGAFMEGEKDD